MKTAATAVVTVEMDESDFDALSYMMGVWDDGLQKASAQGRFLRPHDGGVVYAPMGSDAYWFKNYADVILARAWLKAWGIEFIIGMDESFDGDWVVITPGRSTFNDGWKKGATE